MGQSFSESEVVVVTDVNEITFEEERGPMKCEIWHIDTTVIRLFDGSRVYVHAVIDNFSPRILSWRLNGTFDPTCSGG